MDSQTLTLAILVLVMKMMQTVHLHGQESHHSPPAGREMQQIPLTTLVGLFFRSEDWVNGVANAYGGDAVAEKTEPLYVLRSRPETLEQSLAKHNPNDHALVERVTYSVGVGPKSAKFCNTPSWASDPYEYPSFPKDVSQAWNTADGGMWSNIRAYFGNASASCSDWSVAQIWPADTVLVGTTPIRADYQSKSRSAIPRLCECFY
jgi:hypothetical protein